MCTKVVYPMCHDSSEAGGCDLDKSAIQTAVVGIWITRFVPRYHNITMTMISKAIKIDSQHIFIRH